MSLLGPTLSKNGGRIRRVVVRSGMLLFVGVLLCVPGLTRVSQRISPSAAPTLSFSKSTECPPKKVLATRVALALAYACACVPPPARAAALMRRSATPLPLSPALVSPRPLRAPPASLVA